MLRDCTQPGRRSMTISVTVLGLALMTVLMAYLAFGDDNDKEGLASLKFIGIVGIRLFDASSKTELTYQLH